MISHFSLLSMMLGFSYREAEENLRKGRKKYYKFTRELTTENLHATEEFSFACREFINMRLKLFNKHFV